MSTIVKKATPISITMIEGHTNTHNYDFTYMILFFVKAFANSRLILPVDRPASTMLPISPNSPNNESIASISHFRLFSTTLSDEQQLP